MAKEQKPTQGGSAALPPQAGWPAGEALAEPADVTQLRAELAMLRASLQQQLEKEKETEAQKRAMAAFLEWVGKTTEEKTQLAADERFRGLAGDSWEVQLPEHPRVRVPAHSEYEAVGRYQEVCGITQTDHKFVAVCLGPLP